MATKLAKDLKVNDVIIDGVHRQQVLEILEVNTKTITYKFKVVSEKSIGHENVGKEYRRLSTKIKIF